MDDILRSQVWRRRKTGELFEVWGVYQPHFVSICPQRPGNRRPLDVRYNNFRQEYELVEEARRRRRSSWTFRTSRIRPTDEPVARLLSKARTQAAESSSLAEVVAYADELDSVRRLALKLAR